MANPSQHELPEMSLRLRERLAFIEFRLWFLGEVSRQDIRVRFGVAPAVATRDLAAYRQLAPQNIQFDGRRKIYILGVGFEPLFPFRADRVLSALSKGYGDGITESPGGYVHCEFPLRLSEPALETLAVISRAIHQQRPVRIKYYSRNNAPSWKDIVPFALVDSGTRWHARVYDRGASEFRDLVLTRMENPVILCDSGVGVHERGDQDIQWSRFVELELVPHPGHSRPDIVARDLGMGNNMLKLRVRAATAGYVLQQWKVDCSPDHSLDPVSFRLWLRDHLVLYGVQSAPLAPGYRSPDQG